MGYTGQNATVIAEAFPVALPPIIIKAFCVEPTTPADHWTVQFNFSSDCSLVQATFFLCGSGDNPPSVLCFGSCAFNLKPVQLNQYWVQYEPTTIPLTGMQPIIDAFTNKPIPATDFSSGKDYIIFNLYQGVWNVAVYDAKTNEMLWESQPQTMDGVPKSLNCLAVGNWTQLTQIGNANFSTMKFRNLVTAVSTTVTDASGAQRQVNPYPLSVIPQQGASYVQADPYDSTKNVTVVYPTGTGETSNLNTEITKLDDEGLSWQIDASPE